MSQWLMNLNTLLCGNLPYLILWRGASIILSIFYWVLASQSLFWRSYLCILVVSLNKYTENFFLSVVFIYILLMLLNE